MARGTRLGLWLLGSGVLALSGCGFTPLYGTPGLTAGLSGIEVDAPEGRMAYLIREDLEDSLARDKTQAPEWRLNFVVTETRDPRGLRRDDVAERYALGMTVHYSLVSVATGRVARTGEVVTQVSYDAADAPYAGISARQNSQERAASDAARRP
jgi:LPS-assembly lipoprotein